MCWQWSISLIWSSVESFLVVLRSFLRCGLLTYIIIQQGWQLFPTLARTRREFRQNFNVSAHRSTIHFHDVKDDSWGTFVPKITVFARHSAREMPHQKKSCGSKSFFCNDMPSKCDRASTPRPVQPSFSNKPHPTLFVCHLQTYNASTIKFKFDQPWSFPSYGVSYNVRGRY